MPNNQKENIKAARAKDQIEIEDEIMEVEEMQQPGLRDAFRTALERARRELKPTAGRHELGRDKSKSLAVLVGSSLILLVLFFEVFSSSKKPTALAGESYTGQPNPGRKITPGQERSDAVTAVVPMMSAGIRSADSQEDGQLTPEEVRRTARLGTVAPTSPPKSGELEKNAIGRVEFSDPSGGGVMPPYPPPRPEHATSADEDPGSKKPSLVFVHSTEAKATTQVQLSEDDEQAALPAGTRLIARLQAPVSSATATPAVAIVEYNYERNGQIVVPAGSKVLGRLAQVNSSGYVDLKFDQLDLPDGRAQKVDASAMSLEFEPLKGYVSGKKGGTKFLVRSLAGIGTMASYLVGSRGSTGEGVLSSDALMRERLADNVGTAGQEALNSLAVTQNLVVTVPGNTRFYIVMQNPTSDRRQRPSGGQSSATADTSGLTAGVPTLEELRQLLELRSEIDELYTQSSSPGKNRPEQQE